MTGSGLGKEIDKHEVVRMKMSKRLMQENPDDYGTRTDIAGGTTAVIYGVIRLYPLCREYWAYIKARSPQDDDPRDEIMGGNHIIEGRIVKIIVPREIHFKWLSVYEKITPWNVRYSTGTGMLIIALEIYAPKEVYLAGFDSILNPDTDWSSTLAQKKYDWKNNPPHDFKSENILLDRLKDHYPTEIKTLEHPV